MLTVSPDGNINRVTPILHYFDKDGVEQWDNPVKFKIDSTMSWTKVMSHLYVDRDDNAIVIGQTLCEIQRENYTIWKVDKTGKQLWGEDGVDPHDGQCPTDQFCAAIRVTQMEAGNYIFAWMGDQTVLQNVSNDGKLQWGEGKRINAGAYPHVVDAGDGDIVAVHVTQQATGPTAVEAVEDKAGLSVSAARGQLYVHNPSAVRIDNVRIFSATGARLETYALHTDESVALPVAVRKRVVVVEVEGEGRFFRFKLLL